MTVLRAAATRTPGPGPDRQRVRDRRAPCATRCALQAGSVQADLRQPAHGPGRRRPDVHPAGLRRRARRPAAAYPILRYVLVSYGDSVGVGETLTEAIADALGVDLGPGGGGAGNGAGNNGGNNGGGNGGKGPDSGPALSVDQRIGVCWVRPTRPSLRPTGPWPRATSPATRSPWSARRSWSPARSASPSSATTPRSRKAPRRLPGTPRPTLGPTPGPRRAPVAEPDFVFPRGGRNVLFTDAGWSSSVARWAHNPEVAGSNPAPATRNKARSAARRTGPCAFRRVGSYGASSSRLVWCVESARVVRRVGRVVRRRPGSPLRDPRCEFPARGRYCWVHRRGVEQLGSSLGS